MKPQKSSLPEADRKINQCRIMKTARNTASTSYKKNSKFFGAGLNLSISK